MYSSEFVAMIDLDEFIVLGDDHNHNHNQRDLDHNQNSQNQVNHNHHNRANHNNHLNFNQGSNHNHNHNPNPNLAGFIRGLRSEDAAAHVCAFQLLSLRFYTHGSGRPLTMSPATRRRLFPENWRDVLRTRVKPRTLEYVETHDIKSLKTYVRSTYLSMGRSEKVVYVPRDTEFSDVHHVMRCRDGYRMQRVRLAHAHIHHYRPRFGTTFPKGPHKTWVNTFKHLIFGKPDVREVNDTTMVRYADELAMRVHRTHQAVKKMMTGDRTLENMQNRT